MAVAEIYEQYKNKSTLVFSLVFLFGVILLTIGLFAFLRGQSSSTDIKIVSADAEVVSEKIVVHVDGAVNNPGVYELPTNSRTKDAVLAAGGLSEDADMAKVNLASKVTDGQKILVARAGESESQSVRGTSTLSSLISINDATEGQLDGLPGIGPVTAQKIIASRPYSTLEDLKTKKAVSSSVFEKIKDQPTNSNYSTWTE
ncbi:MAG: ComEA family DNA-binding protein [Candidatus Curtissbacteria bacterium]|nr:ComEA family DNA-binding protein [Candidatus Curtissbacteria bacterium]